MLFEELKRPVKFEEGYYKMVLKACKQCRAIYESGKCPQCGSSEITDSFKGKIYVKNPDESEVAQKLGIKKKGLFAIRLK